MQPRGAVLLQIHAMGPQDFVRTPHPPTHIR
jgi:hypothetical protein